MENNTVTPFAQGKDITLIVNAHTEHVMKQERPILVQPQNLPHSVNVNHPEEKIPMRSSFNGTGLFATTIGASFLLLFLLTSCDLPPARYNDLYDFSMPLRVERTPPRGSNIKLVDVEFDEDDYIELEPGNYAVLYRGFLTNQYIIVSESCILKINTKKHCDTKYSLLVYKRGQDNLLSLCSCINASS